MTLRVTQTLSALRDPQSHPNALCCSWPAESLKRSLLFMTRRVIQTLSALYDPQSHITLSTLQDPQSHPNALYSSLPAESPKRSLLFMNSVLVLGNPMRAVGLFLFHFSRGDNWPGAKRSSGLLKVGCNQLTVKRNCCKSADQCHLYFGEMGCVVYE